MMLVLKRNEMEQVVCDLREFGLGLLTMTVVELRQAPLRLGIDADSRIPIHRREVFDAIEAAKQPEPSK